MKLLKIYSLLEIRSANNFEAETYIEVFAIRPLYIKSRVRAGGSHKQMNDGHNDGKYLWYQKYMWVGAVEKHNITKQCMGFSSQASFVGTIIASYVIFD